MTSENQSDQDGGVEKGTSGNQPDSEGMINPGFDILVDDHEEEVSVNGKTERRRGVYLLPNLFTTGTLFAGFYSIVAAMRGDFESAAIAVFAAMVFDGLDGRVARLTQTSSKFGIEYDSLSDVVAFGVAPALVVFSLALGELGKFGWSASFIFLACAALRLARFNTHTETADRSLFTGLASPPAAAILASVTWVCSDLGYVGSDMPDEIAVGLALLTSVVGFLMIANFPYYSFKQIDFKSRVPFPVIIIVVFIFSLVTMDPPKVLLVASTSYAASGPIMAFLKWRKHSSAPDPD